MNNINEYLTNQHLFTHQQANQRFSNIINDRYREEFYKDLNNGDGNFKYTNHFIWDNFKRALDVEGIFIITKTPIG